MEDSRLMPLYDAAGRKVEPGDRVWLTTRRYEPYVAFRERPDDDPDVDLTSMVAEESRRGGEA